MSTAARSVGFIGLGQMGFGMAENLLKAGHDVLAYDVAAEPLARFAARGGRAAPSRADRRRVPERDGDGGQWGAGRRRAIGEAFAMAKQAGVPLDRLYQTLRTCTADSWTLRSLEGAILRGEYPPATFLGLKDLTAAFGERAQRAPGDARHLSGS
jgi:3-hydroxyisobutyrate dehydrogenase-like beta-hydroxyacid dehydrogenase